MVDEGRVRRLLDRIAAEQLRAPESYADVFRVSDPWGVAAQPVAATRAPAAASRA